MTHSNILWKQTSCFPHFNLSVKGFCKTAEVITLFPIRCSSVTVNNTNLIISSFESLISTEYSFFYFKRFFWPVFVRLTLICEEVWFRRCKTAGLREFCLAACVWVGRVACVWADRGRGIGGPVVNSLLSRLKISSKIARHFNKLMYQGCY